MPVCTTLDKENVNAQDAWNAAYGQLELQLDRANFDTWLRDTFFLKEEAGIFVIGVRNAFARDMLQHRLYRNIRRVLSDVCGHEVELRFEVSRPPRANQHPADETDSMPSQPMLFDSNPEPEDTTDERPLFQLLAQRTAIKETETNLPPLHEQIRRPALETLPENELNPDYLFDRFIVNGSNHMAYEGARAVAENPGRRYNPFLVYGGVGLGKTHLLQAIAQMCVVQGLRVLYLPSEVFTNDLVDAIRHKTTAMFREKYRSADVLLVDDIQFIAGKDSTQEEFFHTFNALHRFGKQIVLALDRHPRELSTLEDRLRSRFESGLIADMKPLEFESRVAILRMWSQERGVKLDLAILEMIANHATTNVRELQGTFNQIVAKAQFAQTPISIAEASQLLGHFESPRDHLSLRSNPRLKPELIINVVADHFSLRRRDIEGKKRAGHINHARQIAMYLIREWTETSLSQIGDYFGGRSHTTVLHACNKIGDSVEQDPGLRITLREIESTLGC